MKKVNANRIRSIFSEVLRITAIVFAILLFFIIFKSNQLPKNHRIYASGVNIPVGISPGSGFETPFNSLSSSQQQAVLALMKSDGVQWLRLDYWPNSTYDYSFISDAEAEGINVDVLLEDFSATPSQFASFAAQAVTTFKPLGVNTFEILNEVNNYTPSISAAQYTAMLKAVYPAIKAADPQSTVLLSGLAMTSNVDSYLQSLYNDGAKSYFDAANVHPYTYPSTPDQFPCPTSNTFCYGIPALHTVMQKNGDGNKQIWITEFGCPTGTDADQPADCTDATLAQQIIEAYSDADTMSYVNSFFMFSWQDNTLDGDYGIYYANGTPKPDTLAAFEQISSITFETPMPSPTSTPSPTSLPSPTTTLSPTPIPSPTPGNPRRRR